MGSIIKINIYAEIKKAKNKLIDMKTFEKNILNYNNWLRKTNREDKIENYEKYLQIK